MTVCAACAQMEMIARANEMSVSWGQHDSILVSESEHDNIKWISRSWVLVQLSDNWNIGGQGGQVCGLTLLNPYDDPNLTVSIRPSDIDRRLKHLRVEK